jgi:hypothetical protein
VLRQDVPVRKLRPLELRADQRRRFSCRLPPQVFDGTIGRAPFVVVLERIGCDWSVAACRCRRDSPQNTAAWPAVVAVDRIEGVRECRGGGGGGGGPPPGVAWTGGCSTLVDGGRAVAGVLAEGPAAAVDEAAALDEEVSWPANFVTSGAWEECEAPVGAPVAAVAVELDGGRPLGSRGGTCGLPHAFVGGVEDVGSGAASNPRFPPFAAFHGEPRPPLLIFFGLRLSLHWRSTSKPVAGGTRPLLPQPVS